MGKFLNTCRKLCFCCRKPKYVNEMTNEFEQKDDGPTQGFENIAYEREPPPENTYKSKLNDQKLSNVIQTIDFIEQYKDMVSYEDMEREFNDIKSAFRAETGGACQLAENRGKNRYMNIMPNDITRVKLSNQTNDYINANYISIKEESEYIATQGPLPGTKEDFWNMVWNENSRTIIMLTQLVEGGRIKCDQYWPFDDKSGDCQVLPNNPKIGQLKIMPKNPTKPHFNSVFSSKPKTREAATPALEVEKIQENIMPLWTERIFYLHNDNESRKIKQYHLTSWVNTDTPQSMFDFVNFIRHIRSEQQLPDIEKLPPIIVHCSDGALKSGLFIAIDKVLSDLQNESFVDILGLVYKLKLARQVLISSENQYKIIYETVRDFLTGKFNEPDEVSNGKRFSSNEYLNEDPCDPQKRNTYFNPALVDDSSSDSSSSLTDSEDDVPTTTTMKPHPNGQVVDNSSSSSMETF